MPHRGCGESCGGATCMCGAGARDPSMTTRATPQRCLPNLACMRTRPFTLNIFARNLISTRHYTMSLPNKYQNGSIDSSTKGVYRASPVKLMIYGNGRQTVVMDREKTNMSTQEQAASFQMSLPNSVLLRPSSLPDAPYTRRLP